MRVLIIEDDSSVAGVMELVLKGAGMSVYATDLGEEGIDLAQHYDYDAITLDGRLPDMSGLDVLRKLRASGVRTPVIMVSGSHESEAKVASLDAGADDYLAKPVPNDELVARLRAVIRRSHGHAQSVVTTGDLTVNLDAKTAAVRGKPIHLTGKEYQMLELLSLRKGSTLSKEVFLNHLYGGMDEPEMKIVDVFICKLRAKLTRAGVAGRELIDTVWGRGYVLRDPAPANA